MAEKHSKTDSPHLAASKEARSREARQKKRLHHARQTPSSWTQQRKSRSIQSERVRFKRCAFLSSWSPMYLWIHRPNISTVYAHLVNIHIRGYKKGHWCHSFIETEYIVCCAPFLKILITLVPENAVLSIFSHQFHISTVRFYYSFREEDITRQTMRKLLRTVLE